MVKSRSVKRNVKNAGGLLAQAIGILEDNLSFLAWWKKRFCSPGSFVKLRYKIP